MLHFIIEPAFLKKLRSYQNRQRKRDEGVYTKATNRSLDTLRLQLQRTYGRLSEAISKYAGKACIPMDGKDYEVFSLALHSLYMEDCDFQALDGAINLVYKAISRLESTSLNELALLEVEIAEPPRAFIAHEGETRALSILREFLEALGIQCFIAESKASAGRSIEKQVDWTQSKADFTICLATKGKAINKNTGKHYMAPNIADELGRARKVFGSKIILLSQKGLEPHTNIREIVHENFTTTNMEKAFIKIARELANWGFITAGTTTEHKYRAKNHLKS